MIKFHLFHIEANVYDRKHKGVYWNVLIPTKLDDDVELVYRTEEIHDMMNKDYTLYKNAVKHFCQVLNVPPSKVEVTKIYKIHNHLIVN